MEKRDKISSVYIDRSSDMSPNKGHEMPRQYHQKVITAHTPTLGGLTKGRLAATLGGFTGLLCVTHVLIVTFHGLRYTLAVLVLCDLERDGR